VGQEKPENPENPEKKPEKLETSGGDTDS